MSKIIIGIDPDSKAHGVAVYVDGVLADLMNCTLLELNDFFGDRFYDHIHLKDIKIHMEDVCGMNAVFRQRQKSNQAINMKMSNSVGKCQQSQIELERLFHYWGVPVVKHKISKMWKKDKAQLEKVTGWKSQSNEDTRSAAYFGWLGLQ